MGVYAVVDNLAQSRHLDIDHLTDLEAEVVSGLTEGASVILHPSDRISGGTPVKRRL